MKRFAFMACHAEVLPIRGLPLVAGCTFGWIDAAIFMMSASDTILDACFVFCVYVHKNTS